jgi:hypothetical protein
MKVFSVLYAVAHVSAAVVRVDPDNHSPRTAQHPVNEPPYLVINNVTEVNKYWLQRVELIMHDIASDPSSTSDTIPSVQKGKEILMERGIPKNAVEALWPDKESLWPFDGSNLFNFHCDSYFFLKGGIYFKFVFWFAGLQPDVRIPP